MPWHPLRYRHPLQPYRWSTETRVAQRRTGSTTTNLRLPNISSALALRTHHDEQNTAIEVAGSVRTVRKQKSRAFLSIGDGSTVDVLQAVLHPDQAQGLSTGAFVSVRGLWQASPPGKKQSHELQAQRVTLIGAADSEKKYQTAEYLRTVPHLRLRLPIQALLARLRSESDFLLAQFFRDRDFLRLQPPIITSSDCEGAGEVFAVAAEVATPASPGDGEQATIREGGFFRKPTFLTVSSQLHLEAYMHEHPKVWTLSPTFRAEKSDTPRHASEFQMLEVEFRTQNVAEVMDLVEDMIRSLVQGLRKKSFLEELMAAKITWEQSGTDRLESDCQHLSSRWDGLEKTSWPRITYEAAMRLLQDSFKSGESEFIHEPNKDAGLHLEHEKYIATKVGLGQPVFVTDYPRAIKPFYMLPSELKTEQGDTPETVACFDLLLPEVCEVVGGSLREHRLQHLEAAMSRRHLDLRPTHDNSGTTKDLNTGPAGVLGGNLQWYVDLRRFGSVPHGGFGSGFDRILCYLSGIRNIKDVIPWPRHYGKCDC
ncbi:MAG: hypothetical protein LQ350_001022 [Teloschistes chrysophthalmus]|nr:MAG: hypothetical protein LQ350_001022 [Niorma chrysophthalma]